MKRVISTFGRLAFHGGNGLFFLLGALALCRWLVMTDFLLFQVIAAAALVGLAVAYFYGLYLVCFRDKHRVETRCSSCAEAQDCPAYGTGVIYPCPYFVRKRNTKAPAAPKDQEPPAS